MQLQLITLSLILMQSFSHIGFFFMPVDKHSWLIKKKFVNEFLSSSFVPFLRQTCRLFFWITLSLNPRTTARNK